MSELEPDMVDGTESNFLRVSLYLLLALHGFGQVSENGIWVGNGSDFFSAVVAAANLICRGGTRSSTGWVQKTFKGEGYAPLPRKIDFLL